MRAPTAAHRQLGRAMREVRDHLGVAQAALAHRMGNTPSYIAQFENAHELPGDGDGGAWQRWQAAVQEIARSKPRDPAWHAHLHDQLTTTTALYTHAQATYTELRQQQAVNVETEPDTARQQRSAHVAQDASLDWVGNNPAQDDDVRRAAFIKLAAASGLAFAETGRNGLIQSNMRHGALPALSALPKRSWATPIYQAVLDPTEAARRAASEPDVSAGDPRDGVPLRRAADTAIHASLASDFVRLAEVLPALIGKAEFANLQAREADRPGTWQLLSDVYAVAGWALIKADSPAAAWIAAQRAAQLAEQADDVLRGAAAMRCLSEVHMRARSFEEASRSAFLAATYLDTARTQQRGTVLCLRGAALLSAAAAAARRGDSREARTALKAAEVCADDLKEDRTELGTVFGPSNVAIHQVAVAVELGNARGALQHAPKVRLDRLPRHLTERRARFLIDVARSHAHLHDHTAALETLLHAEQIAPDELRHHRLTHELVRGLLVHERRSSGLRALADRCKLLN